MKSYQFYTDEGRGGTMLCDDDTLEIAVSELKQRFKGVIKVQYGTEVWEAAAQHSEAEAETEPNAQ